MKSIETSSDDPLFTMIRFNYSMLAWKIRRQIIHGDGGAVANDDM